MEIRLETIQSTDNKEIAKAGTARDMAFNRRSGRVIIIAQDQFYARNWLAGNKIPYDSIVVEKPQVVAPKFEPAEQTSRAQEVVDRMAKARAARKYHKKEAVNAQA